MGITSECFQQERDETPSCQFATVPNDVTPSLRQIGAIENFANFQRFLAPPTALARHPGWSHVDPSGASAVHRHRLRPVSYAEPADPRQYHCGGPGQPGRPNLFSDLLLHAYGARTRRRHPPGPGRADEFRTAPLWGLGQRLFFLHDGRTTDLIEAIQAHRSDGDRKCGPSEANAVIDRFNALDEESKQDVLNFLRSR